MRHWITLLALLVLPSISRADISIYTSQPTFLSAAGFLERLVFPFAQRNDTILGNTEFSGQHVVIRADAPMRVTDPVNGVFSTLVDFPASSASELDEEISQGFDNPPTHLRAEGFTLTFEGGIRQYRIDVGHFMPIAGNRTTPVIDQSSTVIVVGSTFIGAVATNSQFFDFLTVTDTDSRSIRTKDNILVGLIPEPSTYALMLMGLGFMLFVRVHRKTASRIGARNDCRPADGVTVHRPEGCGARA
jgi:hypothetical protein